MKKKFNMNQNGKILIWSAGTATTATLSTKDDQWNERKIESQALPAGLDTNPKIFEVYCSGDSVEYTIEAGEDFNFKVV